MRDLGPLTVTIGTREQAIVGDKAAAVLALLTIHANQRVSIGALMEAAWGDHITVGAASTLKSHLWRLRQVLEPDRDRGQPPSILVSDNDGYRLICGPATLDSLLFAEAAHETRDLLLAGQAEEAVRRAESALALWRSTPYGAFADADWARPAVARLEELWRQLQERRIEALVASGAADTALSDLHPLVAAAPFSQPLRALQMVALHHTGRTETALETYQEFRRLMVDELGIAPGHDLQQLHRRILDDDPELARPAPRVVSSPRPVEVHLPPALTPLVGRADEVERLAALVAVHRLVTVIGAAGSGKTRVAVEVARAVADQFADGVWFVDLTAVADPDLVADVIVSAIGFAGSTGATPVQDLRRYLQARRVLLVLDNCEHVLDAVDEVVRVTLGDPGVTAECCLLLTSREPTDVDGEIVWSLAPLGLPGDDDSGGRTLAPAVELFLQRLAAVAPTLTVDDHVRARAAEIAVAVDGLPLPLELAAARALSHSLDDVVEQVTADPGRLSRLGRGTHDHRATVRSAIDWSHRLLTPDEQRVHRRLAVLPGAFTAGLAADVIRHGRDDGLVDVDDVLARLVHRSMLASEGAPGPGRPTAFRQLATIRSHATHALADAGETDATLDRRDRWVAALLEIRPSLGTSAEGAWYRRLDDDQAAVRAALARRLIDEPCAEGGRMAHRLTYYWFYRERLVEASRWLRLGEAVLQAADPTERLLVRMWSASVETVRRRLDLALPRLSGLDVTVRATPADRLVEVGEALVVLGMAAYVGEAPDVLRRMHDLLTWVVEAVNDDGLALLTDAVGCCDLLLSGQQAAAVRLALSVQERAAQKDNPMASYVSTAPLIGAAMLTARPAEGIPWVDRCFRTYLQFGTGTVGMFIETRANFIAQLGDLEQATRTYAASRVATRRAGLVWPNREWTGPLLTLTRNGLSRADYERCWHEGEQLELDDLLNSAG